MDDPEEHALVIRAITCGLTNCVKWKATVYASVVKDLNFADLTPTQIKREMIEHVNRHGEKCLRQRKLVDENFPDCSFVYTMVVPHESIPAGIFVKLILDDESDRDYPIVRIVSLHKAGV